MRARFLLVALAVVSAQAGWAMQALSRAEATAAASDQQVAATGGISGTSKCGQKDCATYSCEYYADFMCVGVLPEKTYECQTSAQEDYCFIVANTAVAQLPCYTTVIRVSEFQNMCETGIPCQPPGVITYTESFCVDMVNGGAWTTHGMQTAVPYAVPADDGTKTL